MLKKLTLAFFLGLSPALAPLTLHANEMAAAGEVESVDINTADAGTLAEMLSGVGPSRAEAIVRYREAYGPFLTVDDLMEVKGVGKSIVDRNRDKITLE